MLSFCTNLGYQAEWMENEMTRLNKLVLDVKGCFHCTDWNICFDSLESIDENIDTISYYISFCADPNVPPPKKNGEIMPE